MVRPAFARPRLIHLCWLLFPTLLLLAAGAPMVSAQDDNKHYPLDDQAFEERFVRDMQNTGRQDAQGFIPVFQEYWRLNDLGLLVKQDLIEQCNRLYQAGYSPWPTIANHFRLIFLLKPLPARGPESMLPEQPLLTLDYGSFYRVVDSSLAYLEPDAFRRFQKNLLQILPEGKPQETGYYYWRFTQPKPVMDWLTQSEYDSLVALESPAQVSEDELMDAVWTDEFESEAPDLAADEAPSEAPSSPEEPTDEPDRSTDGKRYDEFGFEIPGDDVEPYTEDGIVLDEEVTEPDAAPVDSLADTEPPAEDPPGDPSLDPTTLADLEEVEDTLPPDPAGGAPVLRFNNTNLAYTSRDDSALMKDLTGYLDLSTKTIHVQQARYDWARMNLDPQDIYVILRHFQLNFSLRHFKCLNAEFHYESLLAKPLNGEFLENLKYVRNLEEASFPFFKSTEDRVTIKDFIPNVIYEGGFSLRGQTQVGSGTALEPARLRIFMDDTTGGSREVVNLWSDAFALNPRKLVSQKARFKLFLPDGDTLGHPAMRLYYNVETGRLSISKDRKDPRHRQPIHSSFHHFNIYSDAIRWRLGSDTLRFTAIIDQRNRLYAMESEDYFVLERFADLKGILRFNPLAFLYQYSLDREVAIMNNVLDRNQRRLARAGAYQYLKKWVAYYKKKSDYRKPDEFYRQYQRTHPTAKFKWIENLLEQWKERTPGESYSIPLMMRFYDLEDPWKAVEHRLYILQGSGYLAYNALDSTVKITDRLRIWAKSARNFQDYDQLQLISQRAAGANALLIYNSKVMYLNGVGRFNFSDSVFCDVTPLAGKVTALADRDLRFGGTVAAGKIDLDAGKQEAFRFYYHDFMIRCDSIDSLRFRPTRDPNYDPLKGTTNLMKALDKLHIEGVRGAIHINEPNNKSGRRSLPHYPVFDCYSETYVYWADTAIQGGVYTKDKVEFTIEPFVLDSLEDFDITQLEFQGEMYAHDILPAWRDTLKPVPDNTYGVQEVFEEPTPLYGGKGQFQNKITVDGYGIHGNGSIKYLGTLAESDTFTFHLDSVMATTRKFSMGGGAYSAGSFPEVKAERLSYTWYPRQDRLVLETLGEPMQLYSEEAEFYGKLEITPQGVTADGLVKVGPVQYDSDQINLTERRFESGGGDFNVAYDDLPTKYHFKSNNVALEYDMDAQTANFLAAQPDTPSMAFSQHGYATSLARGSYDRNAREIKLEADGPRAQDQLFRAQADSLKGLEFTGGESYLNLDEGRLIIGSVDSMHIADGWLYPGDSQAVVQRGGTMEPFLSAEYITDTTNRYHNLYEATLFVENRMEFSGQGTRDFIEVDGREMKIGFTTLAGRPGDTTTYGKANIAEEENFFITDRILFRGSAELYSPQKYMYFSGEVKINSSNEFFKDAWFPYADTLNPDSIFIPISESTLKGLSVGVHFNRRRREFYSTFIQKKKGNEKQGHLDVLSAEGGLSLDRVTEAFKIGPEDRIKNSDVYVGNLVKYDDSSRTITSIGRMDWPVSPERGDVAAGTEYVVAGRFVDTQQNEDPEQHSFTGELTLGIDLPPFRAESDLAEVFAREVKNLSDLNAYLDWEDRLLQESVAELIDQQTGGDTTAVQTFINQVQQAVASKQDMENPDLVKVGEQLPYSLVLGGLEVTYDDSMHAFYYQGEAELISAQGQAVNRQVECTFEYRFGRSITLQRSNYDTLRISLTLEEGTDEKLFIESYGTRLKVWTTMDETFKLYNELAANWEKKRPKATGGQKDLKLYKAEEMEVSDFETAWYRRYKFR